MNKSYIFTPKKKMNSNFLSSPVISIIFKHGFLLFLVILVVFPFVWMILTSVKDPADIFSDPFSFNPNKLYVIENYEEAFQSTPLALFMLNSLIVVIGILSVQLITSISAAYALAKMNFRGKNLLFTLVLFAICVPNNVISLPLFLATARLDLLNTYFALMFPWFFSAFAIFLFRQHFRTFPQEVINAARIDGFTEPEIVLRLIIPSAIPAIVAFTVFSITAHWNDLYWPMIVVNATDKMTAPVGMLSFENDGSITYGPLMAAATVITLPLVAVFLIAQRYFVEGITMTGTK